MKLAGALSLAGLLAAAGASAAQPALASAATAAGSCAGPAYPREALRYELEGITTLRFRLAASGRVTGAEVARSSGWQLLDDAAIRTIQACAFAPAQAARANGAPLPVKYVWSLDGDRVRPHVVPGSCTPSTRFSAYRDFDNAPSGRDGIKVRLLVDGTGQARGVKPEAAGLAPGTAEALAKYVESCRFGYDPSVPGERTDTAYGRVIFR